MTQLKSAKAAGNLDRCYYAQNTAYVYRGGNKLVKYHKRMNGGEINTKDIEAAEGLQLFWVPGPRTGEFKVSGVRFGVEVCAEHGGGAMQTAVTQTLDVHIVIASSMKLQLDHCHVRDGGYVLYCDSYFLPEVHRKVLGGFQKIDPGTAHLKTTLSPDQMADRLISVREEAEKLGKTAEDIDRYTYDITFTRMSGRLHNYRLPLRA